MKTLAIAAIALVSATTGCSTIVNGTSHPVNLTADVPEQCATEQRITCQVVQDDWVVTVATPAVLDVDKTHSTPLMIECSTKDEFLLGRVEAYPSTDMGAAIGWSGVGNGLTGGLIGVAIDSAYAANSYYDENIQVPMTCDLGVVSVIQEQQP